MPDSKKTILSSSVVIFAFALVLVSILLSTNLLFLGNDRTTTTSTLTSVVTSKVTEIAPTTITTTDTTSLIQTLTQTTTLEGIIPPINDVLISNISLPYFTWAVAVDPNSDTIYAAGPLSNLTVINGSTNKVVTTLSIGSEGSDFVAVDPATNMIYAGEAIINGSTNHVVGYFSDNITDLAIDSAKGTIYALSPDFSTAGNTSLLILNATSEALVHRIPINGSANILATDPVTHTVYVPICLRGNVCAPIYVLVINESSYELEAKIFVNASDTSGIPFAISVDPGTNMIFMTDQQLVSINGTTNTVTAETTVSAFTIQCRGVAVNEMDDEIYVAGWGFGNYGSFFIVNGQNYSLLNAFAGTGQPVGIAYDSANSEIYVANSQTKSILALNSTSFVVSS